MKTKSKLKYFGPKDRQDWIPADMKEMAKHKKTLAMAQDPVIVAAKKAYRESQTYKLDQLVVQRSRWSRKLTIASNKLAETNFAIASLCDELAKQIDGKGKETK